MSAPISGPSQQPRVQSQPALPGIAAPAAQSTPALPGIAAPAAPTETSTSTPAGASSAAPTSYAQAKSGPEDAAGVQQGPQRPRGNRDRMSFGKTGQSGIASGIGTEAKGQASPTANLSAPELQAARDRFGKERTYKIVDEQFHARHPELGGRQIKPGETKLANEWLKIRAGVEEAGIQKAVAEGKSDPKEISRDAFDARHPDLKGKTLNKAQTKELGEIEKQVNKSLEPLNQLKASPSFKALDAAGQDQALKLMRANYQDDAARGRVQEAVDSLGSVKNPAGKTQVLEGLNNGPLTADKLTNTKALLDSAGFKALPQADQDLFTAGVRDAKADPTRVDNLTKIAGDPRFAGLSADLKREVVASAAAGRGTAVQLLDAATFTPGVGLNLTGSAANQATFTNALRMAMVRSPSFRDRMNTQNADAAHPIRMDIGRDLHTDAAGNFVPAGTPNSSNVLGDASGTFYTPAAPGRHAVDLNDIAAFPNTPGAGPRGNVTSGDQVIVHFMVEAMEEANGQNFGVAHQRGIDAENAYRGEMGQAGTLTSRTFGPGPNDVTSVYTGGHTNEVITTNANGDITNITP